MSADAIVANARAKSEALEKARAAGRPAAEIEALQREYTQAVDDAVRATRTVRVCPVPQRWHEFWQLLGSPSALSPLILAGWAASSDREKLMRFQAQLGYALRTGIKEAADRFLSGLREDEWHTCVAGNLDRIWWEQDEPSVP